MIHTLCTRIIRLFNPNLTSTQIINKQIDSAEKNYLIHLEHEEYHRAMRKMYEKRAEKLIQLGENHVNTVDRITNYRA